MKKICLVSDGQPSTNPRFLKEADALYEAGYDLTVIFCQGWAHWAMESDKKILSKRRWKYQSVVWSVKENPYLFYKSRLRFFLARSFTQSESSLNRVYPELSKAVLSEKADLYVAHYLGALSAAAKAAEKYGAKLGFDAEDFHSADSGIEDKRMSRKRDRLIERVEEKYLPRCSYVTAASDPIAQAYATKYKIPKPVTILNVFPLAMKAHDPRCPETNDLSLYWFSQTIGPGRGLEEVVLAMGSIDQPIQLHLQGLVRDQYRKELTALAFKNKLTEHQIVWMEPAHPEDLVNIASCFDVGLTLERNRPLNKDLCVSNKIFTYLLAGLSVIATQTQGQNSILKEIGQGGWSYKPGDTAVLAARLQFLAQNKEALEASKRESLKCAREKYNWDIEKSKFLSVIRSVLD